MVNYTEDRLKTLIGIYVVANIKSRSYAKEFDDDNFALDETHVPRCFYLFIYFVFIQLQAQTRICNDGEKKFNAV